DGGGQCALHRGHRSGPADGHALRRPQALGPVNATDAVISVALTGPSLVMGTGLHCAERDSYGTPERPCRRQSCPPSWTSKPRASGAAAIRSRSVSSTARVAPSAA